MVEMGLLVIPYKDKDSNELKPFNEETASEFQNKLIHADHRPVVFMIYHGDDIPLGMPVKLLKTRRDSATVEIVAETTTKLNPSIISGLPIAIVKVWIAPSDNDTLWTASCEWKRTKGGIAESGMMDTNNNPIIVYQTGEHVPKPNFLDNLLISLRLKSPPQVLVTRVETFGFPYKLFFIGGLVIVVGLGGYYMITRMKGK